MRISILVQLIVPLTVVFTAIAAFGALLAGSAAERAAMAQAESHVAAVVETLRSADYPLTPSVLAQVKQFSGFDMLVWDAGRPVAGTLPTTPSKIELAFKSVMPKSNIQLLEQVTLDNQSYRACMVVLPPRSARQTVTLAVLIPEATLVRALASAKSPPFAIFLLGDLAALAIVIAFARRLARRIGTIQTKAAGLAEGVHPHFKSANPADELGDLAISMNDLADQLERHRRSLAQFERMRLLHQLAGGLAHRLRNGVAGARLALQLHLQEQSNAVGNDTIETALRQLTLVEQHVQMLLQAESPPAAQSTVDLARVAQNAIALVEPKARHLGTRLSLIQTVERNLVVTGDPNQLERLLNVLLENAMEAAGTNGAVRIELATDSVAGTLQAAIRVIDTGPGPSPEIATSLFEPFSTDKIGGVGLGLFVARSIAQAHGGDIVMSRIGDETRFQVNLPLAVESHVPALQPPNLAERTTNEMPAEWSVRP